MAVAPIVTIPVDDSEFEKFKAAFADYHEKLKSTPAEWQAINKRIAELSKLQREIGATADHAWSNTTAEVKHYERAIAATIKSQERLGRSSHTAAAAMHKMSIDAKNMATHVSHTISSLARFGIFSFGAGLVGFGGLTFGLDRLAGSVLSQSKEARSLGITPGQLNSFDANFARVNGKSLLPGIAAAKMDITKLPAFTMLGISSQRVRNENTEQLTFDVMQAIHRGYRKNPTMFAADQFGRAANMLGIPLLESQLIGRTPGRTLSQDQMRTIRDAGALGFSPKVAREWSNFDIQLRKSGILIETAFINALEPLVQSGALPKLSKEIAGFITDLSKSGAVKAAVKELASGIKEFAAWLGSPSFHRDMTTFAKDIRYIAGEMDRWAHKLGLLPSPVPSVEKIGKDQTTRAPYAGISRASEMIEVAANRSSGQYSHANLDRLIAADAAKYHVPVGMMRRVAMTESGYGLGKMISSAGALGPLQVMPATGRDFGYSDMLNASQNVDAGTHYMALLLARYHGDEAKAAAAYNWGPGNLDRDIKAHGSHWQDFLPGETASYVRNVAGGSASIPPPLPPGHPAHVAAVHTASQHHGPPDVAALIRHAAHAQTARYLGLPGARAPAGAPHGGVAPLPAPVSQSPLGAVSGGASSAPLTSGISDVRSRYWRTQHGLNVRVHNQAGANVSVSSTAAAAQ